VVSKAKKKTAETDQPKVVGQEIMKLYKVHINANTTTVNDLLVHARGVEEAFAKALDICNLRPDQVGRVTIDPVERGTGIKLGNGLLPDPDRWQN
jgi:hypothetical protein